MWVFLSYYKNMANFEALLQSIKLSAKLLFLKSDYVVIHTDKQKIIPFPMVDMWNCISTYFVNCFFLNKKAFMLTQDLVSIHLEFCHKVQQCIPPRRNRRSEDQGDILLLTLLPVIHTYTRDLVEEQSPAKAAMAAFLTFPLFLLLSSTLPPPF